MAIIPPADPYIKICGLRDHAEIDHVISLGATHIGLVHFPPSPRHLSLEQIASLSAHAQHRIERVVLLVDPDDKLLGHILEHIQPDVIQLHGAETPEQVKHWHSALKPSAKFWKAFGIRSIRDFRNLPPWEDTVDRFLLDAKPTTDETRPGGLGRTFDWTLLNSLVCKTPWILAGGLTPQTITTAINHARKIPGFCGVDVSSGVEQQPGQKDTRLIADFITQARTAMSSNTQFHNS